jgi:hypothetical protein
MKNSKKNVLIALVFAGLLSSCTKDDVNNIPEVQEVRSTLQTGNWRLTKMIDSGEDETTDFAGYTFTFSENGTLTAVRENNTQTGRWSVINDRDRNEHKDDIEFNISFAVPESKDFDDLNNDWDIISISNTIIELIDRGDANESSDFLTFERN